MRLRGNKVHVLPKTCWVWNGLGLGFELALTWHVFGLKAPYPGTLCVRAGRNRAHEHQKCRSHLCAHSSWTGLFELECHSSFDSCNVRVVAFRDECPPEAQEHADEGGQLTRERR